MMLSKRRRTGSDRAPNARASSTASRSLSGSASTEPQHPTVLALATLAYGSLSDRYGRRPLLLSGLALFLVGSAIAAVAQSAATLMLGRLVQALGAGCSPPFPSGSSR